jgi:formamidopyrimidine-DNA glycosylase
MSTSDPRLEPTGLQSLLTLVRAQSSHPETMTLAEAEAAVITVLRQVGPELVQAALDADKAAATAAKKRGRRRCAAGKPCASADGDRAR